MEDLAMNTLLLFVLAASRINTLFGVKTFESVWIDKTFWSPSDEIKNAHQARSSLTCEIMCILARDTCSSFVFGDTCQIGSLRSGGDNKIFELPQDARGAVEIHFDKEKILKKQEPRLLFNNGRFIADFDLTSNKKNTTRYWYLMEDIGNIEVIVYDEKHINFLLCGHSDQFKKACYVFSPGQNDHYDVKKTNASMLFGHLDAGQAVVDDNIWITGGSEDGIVHEKTELLIDGKWLQGPDLPRKSRSHAVVQISQDEVAVIGGHDGDRSTDEVWIYNSVSQTWRRGSSMPVPVSGLACLHDSGQSRIVCCCANVGDFILAYDYKRDSWIKHEHSAGHDKFHHRWLVWHDSYADRVLVAGQTNSSSISVLEFRPDASTFVPLNSIAIGSTLSDNRPGGGMTTTTTMIVYPANLIEIPHAN